jgi:hypothetical protein
MMIWEIKKYSGYEIMLIMNEIEGLIYLPVFLIEKQAA